MSDVAWLTSSFPWEGDRVGGIFFRTQAMALARAGLPVTVVAPRPAVPWPLGHLKASWRAYDLTPRQQRDGPLEIVRPTYLNVPGQPSWAMPDRFIADAAWRSHRHWGGARLVHGHYSLVGLATWRLARRARIPFVLTFHGSDINTWPTEHPERLDDLRAAVRGAAAVFTVSGALAQRVRSLTGVEAIHLPIGSDHHSIRSATLPRAEARQQLGLPVDRMIALFVGRMVREKGVHEFIGAIQSCGHPFVGVLVGSGPELASLEAQADPHAIVFAGARSHDEVVKYMSAADVLVLPSYAEGLPTVLVEAGSVRLPVIASAVGGIPELLADERGSLLEAVSVDAVATALRAFRDDRERAQAGADRLHTHVLAEYDVDRNAERLIGHYGRILGSVGHP